eukprot:gene7296-7509_t
MADENRPSADPILELLNGFRKSKVLFTLTSLNVPELIARSNQERLTASQLARLLARGPGTAPSIDGLSRLLDAAVGLGLLVGGREGYGLNDVARTYLCTASEYSLVGYVIHSDQLLYKLWGELQTSVLSGSNCWGEAFGVDSSDVFASMYKEESTILRFLHGMHSFSKLSAQAVLTTFDLSAFRTLVDLGGATGALATAACGLYPQMRAVVVDLPHVISKATQHFATAPEAQNVQDRLSWVAGDFFTSEQTLPAGDLYVLSRVLHDWEEARCAKLLRTVYQSLPIGGALLICEMLLDESGTSPPEVLLQSLNMLAQTYGRERKLSEYCHVLETAGFRKIEGKKTGAYLDAILAYKTLPGEHDAAGIHFDALRQDMPFHQLVFNFGLPLFMECYTWIC